MSEQTTEGQKLVVTSQQWLIDMRDVGKGLSVAAISAAIGAAYGMLNAGEFGFDHVTLMETGKAALGGCLAYLLHKFGDKSKIILPNSPTQPVETTVITTPMPEQIAKIINKPNEEETKDQ